MLDVSFETYAQDVRRGPVALFLQTTGPHVKSSHLSQSCTAQGVAADTRNVAAAVACTARLVRAFVDRVEEAFPDRSRQFVLVSDHLAHLGSATPKLKKGPRRNSFAIFGTGIGAGQVNDRRGSLVDVFPTVLQAMGLSRPPYRGGLGVSLLSGAPSYMTLYEHKDLSRRIASDVRLRRQLWDNSP